MRFTIYTSNSAGDAENCVYPNRVEAASAAELAAAVRFDHVAAKYRNNYRSNRNFEEASVIEMDVDNDHSENPEDWVTPEKLAEDEELRDVEFATTPSRHNMKPKKGKSARPRFHFHAPIAKCESADEIADLKQALKQKYPFFDEGALDAARFMYGLDVRADDVFWHEGFMTVDEIVDVESQKSAKLPIPAVILEGSRNSTLSHFAGRVLKRYGETEKAHDIFLQRAEKCEPPLSEAELSKIWRSAVKFCKRVQGEQGYISPEEYNNDFGGSLKPKDYSDLGQSRALIKEYGNELRFTPATDYLRYNGQFWEESWESAVGAAEEFLDLQLADAEDEVDRTSKALCSAGLSGEAVKAGGKALEKLIGADQRKAYQAYVSALAYRAFALKRRDMKYIVSALQAAKPPLLAKPTDFDKDAFLLNCQDGTYDLAKGTAGRHDFVYSDYITKICSTAPGDEGKEIWMDFLYTIFEGDVELVDYVQKICGLVAVGSVYLEALIISYGEGANGKSTFWNTIAWVLGTYAGGISADALTAGCRRNVKPEIADAKGKRLLIAAELEEGVRLSASIVKQLCSTDKIRGEKKFKAPFDFTPSHTLVLYTNHLPKVGGMDTGIWRRLIVIPFGATITGKKDIKNYAGHLQKKAAPYILKWIIEGAQKAIADDFNLRLPQCVENAIGKYKDDSDWLSHFLDDCCEIGERLYEKSGEFYSAYRAYCTRMGDYIRSTTDFYNAVEQRGFERKKRRDGNYVLGLRLCPAEHDF
ncbi:MAG: primase C-terminal domain-containing protein [Schwartzia sp.]|nr:primase C-terminal domain-containing protein [Schwartzia sp. (in: firmicutes)]